MLTDIFAYRYLEMPIWDKFDENARRLLVQGFRIISEQLFPYYDINGNERPNAKKTWEDMNNILSMELGLDGLSSLAYGFYNPKQEWVGGFYNQMDVCKNFVCAKYDQEIPADQFIKERLSFIEIAFRKREEEIISMNASLPQAIASAKIDSILNARRALQIPGDPEEGAKARNKLYNDSFKSSCDELNQRFKQARINLHYHNGYIQISKDKAVQEEIEEPFWALLKEDKWKNVDHDMKEALDLRDSNGRDPAWYAAKALESTIKIISNEKGWTSGQEKGAANYINNLRAKRNGEYINSWEHSSLLSFFSNVRNPLGHGAGSEEMPSLSVVQTDWAIEYCMIWIKNLIKRL